MHLSLVIHRCSAELNCLSAKQLGKAEWLAGNKPVGFEVVFFFFFPNPLWQMLTKVNSKDNPKSKPIVHIYFLKRAILGVLNMKQYQTVKQIPYQG